MRRGTLTYKLQCRRAADTGFWGNPLQAAVTLGPHFALKGGPMRHLDNVVHPHTSHHIQIARTLVPRNLRWKMGAQLICITKELIRNKETHNCKGFAALNRGGLIRTMWVAKKAGCGLKRGQQVHSKAAMEEFLKKGNTFRTIQFPRDTAIKDALKKMARIIEPVHHPIQYGFVAKRNCTQSAAQHAWARTVYLLDIENAFDQITFHEVREILTKVFYVNKKYADFIALLCAPEGHLYQGNPMSPALFNIRALWMAERLDRLCKANDATVTLYADDITISHKYWEHISSGFQKTVRRIIGECGLSVNEAKCKVRRISPNKIGHYDITGLTIDFDPYTQIPLVRPLHRKRTLRKADYLQYLTNQGIDFSQELAKDGSYKSLDAVIAGLRNWSKTKGQPPNNEQLTLRLAT